MVYSQIALLAVLICAVVYVIIGLITAPKSKYDTDDDFLRPHDSSTGS